MQSIYKYPLSFIDTQEIELPTGAQVLTVQVQRDNLQLWALVDPEIETVEKRKFIVIGTGNPINDLINTVVYISTIQIYGGALVFHVFEVTQ